MIIINNDFIITFLQHNFSVSVYSCTKVLKGDVHIIVRP